MVAILTDHGDPADVSPGAGPGTGARELTLEAIDPEDRLVQWLNEVIVAAIVDGFLLSDIDALELTAGPDGGARLHARFRGHENAGARIATELKSVTYHDLRLVSTETRVECQVVIDV